MTFSPEQIEELRAPLDRKQVKSRRQGSANVSYIEGWHVIDEANRIFGFGAWSRETVLLLETNRDLVTLKNDRGDYQQWRVGYLAKVKITVDGVVREGTGFGSGMSRPEALGEAIESAIKEAETDAMKRAFMTFGNPFGLALYDKTQANVANIPDEPKKSAEPAKPNVAKASTESKPQMNEAMESLWMELSHIQSAEGLRSFWIDNSKAVAGFDEVNRARFTKKKDELKASFETDRTVADIQDTFPGAKVVDVRRIEETFPGDLPFNDEELRRHPMNAG